MQHTPCGRTNTCGLRTIVLALQHAAGAGAVCQRPDRADTRDTGTGGSAALPLRLSQRPADGGPVKPRTRVCWPEAGAGPARAGARGRALMDGGRSYLRSISDSSPLMADHFTGSHPP